MVKFFIYTILNSSYDENQLLVYFSKFENEYAQAWHWIPIPVWNSAVNNFLDALEIDFTYQIRYQKMFLERIINLLTYNLYEENKSKLEKFLRRAFAEEFDGKLTNRPSLAEIRELKAKFNNGNGIHIPKYISAIYPNISLKQRKLFPIDERELKLWGGILLSPIFAALAFSGSKEIFMENNYGQYQRILYYMNLDSEWYFDVFERISNRIHKNSY